MSCSCEQDIQDILSALHFRKCVNFSKLEVNYDDTMITIIVVKEQLQSENKLN